MSLVRNATPSILLSRNLCFSKCLGKSIEVSMMLMGNFENSTKLNTGQARLIRSHSSARFCFELSGNSN